MRHWTVLLIGVCLFVPSGLAAQEMPGWAAPQSLPDPSAVSAAAAQDPVDCGDANPNCVDVDPVPVGEGLALLALLGAGYAAHRLRQAESPDAS